MEIRKRSTYYEIYLPTGARVVVSLYRTGTRNMYLNVRIPGTILDVGASRGLCGQLSATTNDDFIMRNEMQASNFNTFVNSWRVTTGDLFNPDYVQTLTTTSQQPPKYCFCEGGRNITCSSLSTMNTEVKPEHYEDVPCVVRLNRKKRAVQNTNIDTQHRYKRQTPSEVWTNQTAADFCNNLFAASSTVQLCRNVPGVNVDNSRDDCISDILLSGTTEFQMMSIDTVRSSCETEVLLNPDLWVADPNNPGAPSVFDTITNNVCPNDCSRRGTCQRGLCVCSAGFGGADCSVDLTQPPQLDEVEDNGHCDLATSSCQRLTVFGLTFLEDVTIKCRSTMFTVSNGGDLHQPNTQVTNAIERSLSEVECPVRVDAPRGIVTAYNISVANTGNIYSEDVMVLVYDSTCVSVDHGSRNWIVRNGFRVENGRCISNDSSRSTSRSTPSSTSTSTPSSTSTSTPMIEE
ncbi:uncharacterized protein LOC124266881 [Haliotis rubra]|uniref:uncharacterized protein LOC124266881 n=1 Tax=Haliotis rubra TaxID=36100 RepID=UPI001EE4F26E|nr:uncharacterized protein LOC124266881 [Haliotis rubra]